MDLIEIKSQLLPSLFQDTARIAEYGANATGTQSLDAFSEQMEKSPVANLAAKIGEIVSGLADADPQKVAEKPNWLARFTGKSIETHVRYQVARQQLDELLIDADVQAQQTRDALRAIEVQLSTHHAEAERLRVYIQAGREFLTENPDIGKPVVGDMEFENPRERFARKLANLSTLLASQEMSVAQLKLTKANAIDMLDRFNETVTVLVPVWRQHSMAIATSKNLNSTMVHEATQAHQALMRSLMQTMAETQQ